VVPQGVDPPPEVSADAFRASLGLTGRVALFCGRLDIFHKGLDRLLDEFASSRGWTLVLVGPDQDGSLAALHALASRDGVADRVVFAGQRTGLALHEALAAADVFVLLSRWEGFPITLLEAFGQGTPAVVSPEVERHVGAAAEGAAWVSPAGGLAATLDRVAASGSDELARRGEAARRIARRHQWGETAAQLEAVYRSVLRVA
jgi:glycosyltransferase involved in cell wall biosynthesis